MPLDEAKCSGVAREWMRGFSEPDLLTSMGTDRGPNDTKRKIGQPNKLV